MKDPDLHVMISPEGTYWIEFAWKNSAGDYCRISSGWITPDNPDTIHRMAFVEAVVDRMSLMLFGAGSNPAMDNVKVEQHVIPPQFWFTKARPADALRPEWEAIVIFKALWPVAPPLVEFKNGLYVVRGPPTFAREEDMHRAATWEDAIRSAALVGGIDPERIERMIVEAKRARREMSSPYFGNDDARGPGA